MSRLAEMAHPGGARQASAERSGSTARSRGVSAACSAVASARSASRRSEASRAGRAARSSRGPESDASADYAADDDAQRTAERRVFELIVHQLRLFDTVTGSPTNGVTRVRATALSTQERMPAGGAEAPK